MIINLLHLLPAPLKLHLLPGGTLLIAVVNGSATESITGRGLTTGRVGGINIVSTQEIRRSLKAAGLSVAPVQRFN